MSNHSASGAQAHLLPHQVTLEEAIIERGERREGGVEYDGNGEAVTIIKCPEGVGSFKDPRDALRGMRGARAAAAEVAASAPRRPPPSVVWEPPQPAVMTPRELMSRLRSEGKL
jgi:hypothetical protein